MMIVGDDDGDGDEVDHEGGCDPREGVMNYPICQQWQTLAVPGTHHISSSSAW